jgi:hypothetical protein
VTRSWPVAGIMKRRAERAAAEPLSVEAGATPIGRRGRRPGSRTPIPEDKLLLRRVMTEALHGPFGVSVSGSARAGVALDHRDFVLIPTARGISIAVPLRDAGLAGSAGTITRSRSSYRVRADAGELEFFEFSVGAVFGWLHAAATGNNAAEHTALEALSNLDPAWPEFLGEVMAALMAAPLRTDLTVQDRDRLNRHVVALLKAILRKRGRDVDIIFRAQICALKSRKRRA